MWNNIYNWLFGTGYQGTWLQQHICDVDNGVSFVLLTTMLVFVFVISFSKKLRSIFF